MTIVAPQRLPLPGGLRLALGLLALLVGGVTWYTGQQPSSEPRGEPAAAARATATDPALLAAIRAHASRVWVETPATVVKLLADDTDGAEHQRFLVAADGHSLLVAHNTDLAPRVPLAVGDAIRVRARYEWNAQGGVLHWTHHDPERAGQGGWIRVRDEVYK
jgi:hypothetical protein